MKAIFTVLVIVVLFVASVSFAGGYCRDHGFIGTYVNADYDDEGIVAKCRITNACAVYLFEKTTDNLAIW